MKSIEEYNKLYNWKIPEVCPACKTKLGVNESGFPFCPNENCSRKLAHQLSKTFEVLEIKGAGDAFISAVEESGITYEDFFYIINSKDSERVFISFAQGINGKKILKQLRDAISKPITVPKFLAMFDYKGFDEKKLKKLNYTLDECLNIKYEELLKIDGFAEITANNFISFMNDKKDQINEIRKYFTFSKEEKSSGKLNGLSFCFTGTAIKPRTELQKIVEDNGGINKSSVTKGLSYLVNDDIDSTTSKNLTAKKLGVPIISSTDFLRMV